MSSDFRGSCLCGAVGYEITGTPLGFYHCHCRRCRKASGTGHASNIILKPDNVSWTAGEENIGGFNVPDAKRFRTAFCKTCGSPLPRVAPDLSIAAIPAGSLDNDPPLKPTARIFWDSRAPWSCDSGDITSWPEYPQQS